ncbi:hypothetical protein KC338_g4244 [Hortaea werneckii]|nr:hypothetical protein KC323_g7026 [Hortaea werneckii]KAI6867815.1 hypothetical protein KC338_g4244 [Hortaea werneckii]KAI7348243.1 hypothetical protein KC320_g6752 [Hortaea werneckii]RMY72584.1 hypothetical protein D0863_04407 [Hortaea werneckii]RMZ04433.1 hypothetical protein D0862_05302 [Hortaea werneckii]
MPPRPALSTPLRGWRCPQCAHRSFTTSPQVLAVGPEHPRYIDVPEPPQQTVPDRKFVKGRLPVPRDVFSGARGQDKASEEWLHDHTQVPKERSVEKGSREEWKHKMSDMRRRNLREGLASLRARKDREQRLRSERSTENQRRREALLNRPEREDERLTTPSTGLDPDLLRQHTPSAAELAPIRAAKQANLQANTSAKRAERLDHLHTLYLNAKTFIVTPQQLDQAVDEAFGTVEDPVRFDGDQQYEPTGFYNSGMRNAQSQSVWAQGKPERVQDMLNRANNQGGKTAMENASTSLASVNKDRVRRIGEVLTGGKMEKEDASQ